MRCVVRAALTGGSPGDLSALVNPDVVEELRASRLAGASGKPHGAGLEASLAPGRGRGGDTPAD